MYLPDCSFWSTYPIFFIEYRSRCTVVFANPTDCVISSRVIGALGFWLKASSTPNTLSVNAMKFLARTAARFGVVGLRPGAAFARGNGIIFRVSDEIAGYAIRDSEGLPFLGMISYASARTKRANPGIRRKRTSAHPTKD